MNDIKIFALLLFGLTLFGCASETHKMNETELYIAKKFNAKLASIQLRQIQTKSKIIGSDSEFESEFEKFISVSLTNTDDMNKIMTDQKYAKNKSVSIVNFFRDSIDIDFEEHNVKDLKIEFYEKSGFFLFQSEKYLDFDFELN